MTELHPALAAAREMRHGARRMDSTILMKLAEGDTGVFKHAMVEAGGIVDAETQKPHPKCPLCKWNPEDDMQLSLV